MGKAIVGGVKVTTSIDNFLDARLMTKLRL
jgi:hypothetical protein